LLQQDFCREALSSIGAVGLALRASSVLVIAFALAGFDDRAAAQSYPPPVTSAPLPPLEAASQSTDPTATPYGRAAYTYRDESGVPPKPYSSGHDTQTRELAPHPPEGRPDFALTDRAGPPSRPSLGRGSIPRPPADVGGDAATQDITAAVRPADSTTVIAALPPEDQPEGGPAKQLPPQFRRQLVDYATSEPPGTIIIDTPHTFLYLVGGHGKAMRYGIGVGREGFTWSGNERITRMSQWPDWHPPKEMIERQPYLPRFMAGGESNPLGARALYLGNTIYRIHGTNQPSTIGSFVSSGCIRLTNGDIEDLYGRVNLGTRVVVLPGPAAASAPAQGVVMR
jgi:lipoprotein-anchoring transpeptidase ErfK/SrfK